MNDNQKSEQNSEHDETKKENKTSYISYGISLGL